MNCQNCMKEIPRGAMYCNYCGEKIAEDVKKEAYSHTIWGKIQWLMDLYQTVTLQKVTGHWLFKTAVIVMLLLAIAFGFWGDAGKMKFTPSETYTIVYNTDTDIYCITSEADTFSLSLYIPKNADAVRYTGFSGETAVKTEEYTPKTCDIRVNKGEFSEMLIEMLDKGEIKQAIRFTCK